MRAKFVNEAIRHLSPKSKEEIELINEKEKQKIERISNSVKKHFSFLNLEKNPEIFEESGEISLGFLINYPKDPDFPNFPKTLRLEAIENSDNKIKIMLFADDTAFNGIESSEINDKGYYYIDYVNIEDFDYKAAIKDIQEYTEDWTPIPPLSDSIIKTREIEKHNRQIKYDIQKAEIEKLMHKLGKKYNAKVEYAESNRDNGLFIMIIYFLGFSVCVGINNYLQVVPISRLNSFDVYSRVNRQTKDRAILSDITEVENKINSWIKKYI